MKSGGVFAGIAALLAALVWRLRPGIVLDLAGLALIVAFVAVQFGAWAWLAAGVSALLISWRYVE